jgi:hypothetical protein
MASTGAETGADEEQNASARHREQRCGLPGRFRVLFLTQARFSLGAKGAFKRELQFQFRRNAGLGIRGGRRSFRDRWC